MASLQAREHMNGTLSASSDQRGLFPAPGPSAFSPPPTDEFSNMGSNIMNVKAGANSSLYQICTGLRQRLGDVPGFEEHIIEMEEEEEDSADEPKDPVTLMWNCLRRGYPLMTIYNASLPERPLKFDATKIREDKVGKATTFKFLQACMAEFGIPPDECFLITDLFGEDTNGFVKVTKLVNRVLDILDKGGLLRHKKQSRTIAVAEPAPTSFKAHLIEELLSTERDYIQHLEILQEFKRQITGAIAGDAIHDIFLNLNQLLDFQRRFLVRIEQQNRLPENEQNWGKLFSFYRESFRVYEPFIANQNRCNETVLNVWPKLKKADLSNELKGIVETPSVLLSFLIKPFQRLSKYPLMLSILRTKGGYDLEKQQDLEEGEAAARSIMIRADEAVQKEHHAAAVNELRSRVEDWKGHKINHFGELLHFGNYTVLKGEGAKVVEREVSIIFDSLDPLTRAMAFPLFMHSLHRGTPKTLSPQPWTWALQALNRNMRGDHASNLASVPGHPAEEHYPVPVTSKRRSMYPLRRKPTLECPQPHPPTTVEPPAWTPFRFKSQLGQGPGCETPGAPFSVISPSLEPSERVKPPEEQAADILQNALHILKIGTEPEPEPEPGTPEGVSRTLASESSMDDAYLRIMDWSHNTPFKTNASQAYPSKALTPLQFLLRKSICQPGHLYKFDGAFKNTTLFLFSYLQSSDPTLSLAAHATFAAAAATTTFVTESTPMSDLEKEVADDLAIQSLVRVQYKVYLFERILLCCNEINPNKPKNRVLKQPLVDKKGKPKLQLKGRIFMQNVTDVVTLNQGQYTLQIFWKGDPSVENFVIRFPDEAQMIRWRDTVQAQKKSLCDQARNSGQTGTSATEFNYMKDQVLLKNPYQEDDDIEEEELHSNQIIGPTQSSFTVSRNPSSNSLRSIAGPGRMAPPKFPPVEHGNGLYATPLSLNTNVAPGKASPGEFPGNSYFSPTNDSPTSTRSNSQQSFPPFTRQQTGPGHWPHEENKHRTAPAIGRAPSREGPTPPNSYVVNGRTVTRPSLPVMAASQNPQQQLIQQSRLRSASTPDIHNPNAPGARRPGNSQLQTQAENVPMPPIPSHVFQGRAPLNRSQTSSPVDSQLPIRSATQSPSVHRDRAHRQYQEPVSYDRQGQRLQQSFESEARDYHHGHYVEEPTQLTPQSTETSTSANSIIDYPNQLKVRVKFDPEPSHVTIVVPTFIKHRSLTDRIDSKMAKVTTASIAKKTARLRYEDSDGDMVRIETDEDVHLAIEDWATQNERQILEGPAPDFELHWQQN